MTAHGPDEHGVPGTPRLPDQVRTKVRAKHYSVRTERAYAQWVKRSILYHGKRHPLSTGASRG